MGSYVFDIVPNPSKASKSSTTVSAQPAASSHAEEEEDHVAGECHSIEV